jgi:hypothetical protein
MPATTAQPARKKKGKWTEIDAAAKEVKAAKVAKPKASATKKAEAKKPARGRKPEVPTTPLASAIQAKNEKLVKAGETPISQTALGNAVGVSKATGGSVGNLGKETCRRCLTSNRPRGEKIPP